MFNARWAFSIADFRTREKKLGKCVRYHLIFKNVSGQNEKSRNQFLNSGFKQHFFDDTFQT
ncbi:MAG: hypothetical protein DWQ05_04735 [Calditrichaeota bacterium]|nr:MAG: hypothetical protein DWQ05_04735 [Calditrichota bacterium]